MNIIEHIPNSWCKALWDLQAFSPSSVIAGGALRDIAFNAVVKDLDTFMDAAEFSPLGGMMQMEFQHGWRPQRCLIAAEYAMGMRSDVQGVYEYQVPGLDIPVQIIAMKRNPDVTFFHQVVSRIDFGACQVAFDGTTLYQTAACDCDHADYRFTLVNCEDETQARRSLRRADRFRDRFPDASFDVSLAYRVMGEAPDMARILNNLYCGGELV